MFCSFAKALNYIFLFISLQKEAAKKYFLVSLFILQETNKNNWGQKEREKCFSTTISSTLYTQGMLQ